MASSIEITFYQSPVGELVIGSFEGQLVLCDWRYRKMRDAVDERLSKGLKADFKEAENEINDLTISQLQQYFDRTRTVFELPVFGVGTAFQQSVWRALQQIPFGTTETYLGLSRKLGNELAIRAVAAANGANALSIIVPCHRIIGSDGNLIGYAGGLLAKEKLLKLENPAFSRSNQLSIF